MFAVLADDLSGAAELAGIALSLGLKTEIQSSLSATGDVDMLIINTASRNLDAGQAFRKVKRAVQYLIEQNAVWIYKKTDSVLRGNVLAEIKAILDTSTLKTCLLAPANPAVQRTIINRQYRVQNRPLSDTSFAQDPYHPVRSSDVLQLLGQFRGLKTGYLAQGQAIPPAGVYIAETTNERSLHAWAKLLTKPVLAAGAAEFFSVIMQQKFRLTEKKGSPAGEYGKTVYVCGSSHQNSRNAVQRAAKKGAVVHYLDEDLLAGNDPQQWLEQIFQSLQQTDRLILAVAVANRGSKELARKIQNMFASTMRLLAKKMSFDTLVIEGGETGQAVTAALNIDRLYPKTLLAAGVVDLATEIRNPARCIIKPGSYAWPDTLWWEN